MSAYLALPSDGRQIVWKPVDPAAGSQRQPDGVRAPEDHHEAVSLRWDNEAWTISGTMPGTDVEYVSRVSPLWQPRQFLLFRDMSEPDLWLGTDGRGRWGEMNGAHRPDLDGATDIAIADSIIGLALPIQRLILNVGDGAEVLVSLVDVETLGLNLELLTYERLDTHRWKITSSNRGRDASADHQPVLDGPVASSSRVFDIARSDELEFDVDDHGLPIDIDGRFRRVTG